MAVPPEIVSKSTFTVCGEAGESVTSNMRWPSFSAALASAIEMAGGIVPLTDDSWPWPDQAGGQLADSAIRPCCRHRLHVVVNVLANGDHRVARCGPSKSKPGQLLIAPSPLNPRYSIWSSSSEPNLSYSYPSRPYLRRLPPIVATSRPRDTTNCNCPVGIRVARAGPRRGPGSR